MPVSLYKVASVSSDFQYTLTDLFAPTNLILNGILSNDEWNAVSYTLEACIVADNIQADSIAKTDLNGKVCFENLQPGLYLAVVDPVKQGDVNYLFDSALIAAPSLYADGTWQYQVSVNCKSQIIPPSQADEQLPLSIVKLWKGDKGGNSRPKSVEVEIFKNGKSYKKVTLSKKNNWSYSWNVKKDGAKWTVVEKNIPTSYTMTIDKREDSFVLTNTFVPKKPDTTVDSPETGDTSNIMFYVILMIVSGSMLIILGILGKRKYNEESK